MKTDRRGRCAAARREPRLCRHDERPKPVARLAHPKNSDRNPRATDMCFHTTKIFDGRTSVILADGRRKDLLAIIAGLTGSAWQEAAGALRPRRLIVAIWSSATDIFYPGISLTRCMRVLVTRTAAGAAR